MRAGSESVREQVVSPRPADRAVVRKVVEPVDKLAWLLDFGQREAFTQGERVDLKDHALAMATAHPGNDTIKLPSATGSSSVRGVTRGPSADGTLKAADHVTSGDDFPLADLQRAHAELRRGYKDYDPVPGKTLLSCGRFPPRRLCRLS